MTLLTRTADASADLEIPNAWSAVLDVIVSGTEAWTELGQLLATVGIDQGRAFDALTELDARGWICVWEPDPVEPHDLAVTLTPWAAARLGVRLLDGDGRREPRWAPVGTPDPSPRSRVSIEANAPDRVADPRSIDRENPDEVHPAAARRRAWLAQRGLLEKPASAPRTILGVDLTPWPGPDASRRDDGRCPACGGRPLDTGTYCLCCDRSGPNSDGGKSRPMPGRSRGARPGESRAIPGRLNAAPVGRR